MNMIKKLSNLFIACVICLAMGITLFQLFPVNVQAETTSNVIYGDLDGNKSIDATDALYVLRFAAKIETPTADQSSAGDVDGSGNLDATDALYILQKAAKIIEGFPAGFSPEETNHMKDVLYGQTGMYPTELFVSDFDNDGNHEMIAIYQYSSKFLTNDCCQVWYCDGNDSKQLFNWTNKSGNSFCNVLTTTQYNSVSGVPYIIMNTWQRVALSYQNCLIFGLGQDGDIGKVYEAEGFAEFENDKLFITNIRTDLLPDGTFSSQEEKNQFDIVDGVIQKVENN